MRPTTKGRFAVTAILDLAMCQRNGGRCPLARISERQGISLRPTSSSCSASCAETRSFLASADRGSVTSSPGTRPRLGRDIIRAVDEPMDAGNAGPRKHVDDDQEKGMTHDLAGGARTTHFEYLKPGPLPRIWWRREGAGRASRCRWSTCAKSARPLQPPTVPARNTPRSCAITPTASVARHLLSRVQVVALGWRLGVKQVGCSGLRLHLRHGERNRRGRSALRGPRGEACRRPQGPRLSPGRRARLRARGLQALVHAVKNPNVDDTGLAAA